MIELLESILPYIQGLWTLPWILVGFFCTIIFSKMYGEEKVNKTMKKIGLILLYFFVPLLLFRIFLDNVNFGESEIFFSLVCLAVFGLMYVIAILFAYYKSNKMNLKDEDKWHFIKTVLTNQGRSSAFIGGAMMGIAEWRVFAALYMSIGAIVLFGIIPYILSVLHKRSIKNSDKKTKIHGLPWYLKIFPWYLLSFAIIAILIHAVYGFTSSDLGSSFSISFKFFTQLTIPAALYYVGAGIHPNDLKLNEMKKLFSLKQKIDKKNHWPWIQSIFVLTVIITPIITAIVFTPLLLLTLIPSAWFSVLVINSILPITSTNMFLVPYGIDKKVTALSVTWTTIICVPIVVFLITVFNLLF